MFYMIMMILEILLLLSSLEYSAVIIAIILLFSSADWATPNFVKDAAISAIGSDLNQYTRSAGHPALVNELAVLYSAQFDRDLDAASNFVVTAGATEALFTTMQAFLNPGDEAILFEPFYDAYPSQVKMAGACVKSVALQPCPDSDLADDWVLDLNVLRVSILVSIV